MDRQTAISKLRAHEADFRAMGIEHVAIFGSTARDEAGEASDLDLAVRLRPDSNLGWDYFTLGDRIAALLGLPVDVVTEPVRKARLQSEIDRDRVHVF